MLDETLDKIITTTAHLSNTIDDFMHYFKPNKNKEVFKLDDVIEKTLGIFNCNVDDKEIEVIKNVDDISINSFQNEFIQILINIINNSRDAFKEASLDKMYIFIEAKVNKDEVTIEIKDNAGGIKKEIMDKIFDPYFTTKHQYHGTGIGLYMCKEIIDKHIKGTLEAKNVKYTFENRAYKGASFIIKLKA